MTKITTFDGVPVVDARRAITIEVTPGDLKRANKREPLTCAVAQACRRSLKAEVRVHLSRIYVKTGKRKKSEWWRYQTPRYVRDEIVAFDRGGTFEPCTFTLSPPVPSKRRGKRQGSDTNNGGGKRRSKAHVLKNVRTSPANS